MLIQKKTCDTRQNIFTSMLERFQQIWYNLDLFISSLTLYTHFGKLLCQVIYLLLCYFLSFQKSITLPYIHITRKKAIVNKTNFIDAYITILEIFKNVIVLPSKSLVQCFLYMLLKILQTSQESTCVRVSFSLKLRATGCQERINV